MLKVKKGDTFVFGLTEENIQRLKKDQPIKFNLKQIDPSLDRTVFIIYGKDDSEFAKMFIDHVGPDTQIVDET